MTRSEKLREHGHSYSISIKGDIARGAFHRTR